MSLSINNNKFNFLNLLSKNKEKDLKFKVNNKSNERLLKNIQDNEKIKIVKLFQEKKDLNNNNTINKIDELFNPETLESLKDDSFNIEQIDYQPIKISEEKSEENKKEKTNKNLMKLTFNKKKSKNSNYLINFINSHNNVSERNIISKDKKNLSDFKGNLLNRNNSMNNLKSKNDELTKEINKRLLVEKTLKKKERELLEANMIIQNLKKENNKLKKLTSYSESSLKHNSLNLSKILDEGEIKKLNEEIKILKKDQQNKKSLIIELNSQIQLLKKENNNLKNLSKRK